MAAWPDARRAPAGREERGAARSEPAAARALPRHSLSARGRRGALAFAAFVMALVALASWQASELRDDALDVDRLHQHELRLHELSRTTGAAEVDAARAQVGQAYAEAALRLAPQIERLRELGNFGLSGDPPWQVALQALVRDFERMQSAAGADTLEPVRARLADLGRVLDSEERAAEMASAAQARAMTARMEFTVAALVLIALAGTALFGTVAMRFFARIAADIASMRARTQALPVRADLRQPPLPARDDELGELASSIETLSRNLAARERDLEIERRNVFNHEKMAALGSLAVGVLGEIGNPIAAIDGHARGLLDAAATGGAAAAPAGEAARAILHETARLAAITYDMAALAAPTSTRRELLSLNELVGTAIGLLRFDARLRGIELATRLDHALPAFHGVPDQLVQLLMNLIVNAADAAAQQPRGSGRVQVSTLIKDNFARLEISDNGPGMSKEVRDRAFEPLFTTKPAGLGTGLGLPLCKTIAQAHGGTIELDSTSGQGTTVCVVFPLEDGV